MKRIILFFAVCLGLSVSQTTFADDAETARVASKRTQITTATNTNTTQKNTNRSVASGSRKTDSKESKVSRTTTQKTPQRVVNRTPEQQTTKTVKPRSTTNKPASEKRVSTTSRTTQNRSVEPRKTESDKKTRNATPVKNIKRTTRATELNTDKIANIKSKDYSRCKTVYFDCMDEFCANKDTNLRRCACSSRIHEFDGIKKQLSVAEDRMLDFNQSLLTVSLDKEDAAAINVASEGETAFQKKDRTESEKLLQKITKTLNGSGDSRLNNELSSVSLSLDMDTAWDTVDSLSGISTTAKNGLGLYNAARPVCIEMAREICSDEEMKVAEDSYKLTIQQDCNTVAKSYSTLYNQAQEKIHESGALLDMSRLSIHQQRNSDDVLTCKKKILTQLSDASVCGEGLYKCLDTTGQYINPSTGQAFLSTNLYNLTTLLQEPVGEETWSKLTQNKSFVNFLNSKKSFLEPATEQCQNIADTVWKEFLNDALAKIKLAQNSKLEEIRQSCTKLIAECKIAGNKTLSEFDARALSTFSVSTDKTVNAMCSDVETSCVALMNNIDANRNWEQGIAGISTDVSYDNMIETCTQIGRDCIVQQCNGTSGNFALCQKATDDRRMAILKRQACWNEVLNCVQSADNLANMTPTYEEPDGTFPDNAYYYDNTSTHGRCNSDDKACLITKQIWGDCDYKPTKYNISTNSALFADSANTTDDGYAKFNQIAEGDTLLSWFAENTATTSALDSCNATGCGLDYRLVNGRCEQVSTSCLATTDIENQTLPIAYRYNTDTTNTCITNSNEIITVPDGVKNYCDGGELDVYGNCCQSKKNSNGICVPETDNYTVDFLQTITCSGIVSTTQNEYDYFCPNNTRRSIGVYCVHKSGGYIQYYDSSSMEYTCINGFWLLVDEYGNYFNMPGNYPTNGIVKMSYTTSTNTTCHNKSCSTTCVDAENNTCTEGTDNCTCTITSCTDGWASGCITDPVPTAPEFIITYE